MSAYCERGDVEAVLSAEGVEARLDDDTSGAETAAEQYVVTKFIAWCSSWLDMHLLPLYEAAGLAASVVVNEWCALLVARRLCRHRGNSVPQSLETACEEARKDVDAVRRKEMVLPDCHLRRRQGMTFSNVRVDCRYNLRRIRVERPLSDRMPTQYPQVVDRAAEFAPGEEW